VQDSTGQWWTVNEYPTTGSRLGQLALSAEGGLGATRPKGSTVYTEQLASGEPEDGQSAVFETKPVKAPLHLTGQPMLDVWLTTSTDDGHVAAKLEVIGQDGEPLHHMGTNDEFQATYGVRSLQHIDPMPRGWFEQKEGVGVIPNEVIHTTVRFLPTDLVVPKGGTLRLTIAGSITYSKGDSMPSGAGSTITILHDCGQPSVLRFRMPDKNAHLINVRETDEANAKKLSSKPARMGNVDGAGLASARVCGAKPKALPFQ
jgi:predicted acyl esterase